MGSAEGAGAAGATGAAGALPLVLGTAGHIDHGKTALVRALTGVDTDRLPEEKARGITIDLGFAPLALAGGASLSVVDVPGHEGLVRTMVAGATGIDVLLLVVAADEGVMPQTREHLAICALLGLERAVVALTKTDLVDAEMAGLAAEEVALLLAATPLAGAPVVPVSAVSGSGLDALRRALEEAVAAARPRTARQGPPRLPIDRAFEMRGFGAVVTGTLVGAPFAVGEAVEVLPERLSGRIRGIQTHGRDAAQARPGERCALNLQGVPLAQLARGAVVTQPGALPVTASFDASLRWLPGAPPLEEPAAVELLTGTAERRAHVAPIGTAVLPAGASGLARFHLEGPPLPLLPGDRFIVRGFARTDTGGATLGGGVVLDVAPPHRRRSDPALRRELEALALRDPEQDLRVRIERAGYAGCDAGALSRGTGLRGEAFERALAAAFAASGALRTRDGRCVSRAALAALEGQLLAALEAYHAKEPLRPGMPAAALRGRLPENVPADVAALALSKLAERGEILAEGDAVRRHSHRVELDAGTQQLAERLCAALASAGLEAPALRELAAQVGARPEQLGDVLAHLERQGRLVRAPGDLWFDAAAVEALRERLRAHFRTHDTLDTPSYKALIGTTRRTAVPLMELLDTERFTARRGEVRVLRGR